MSQIDSVVLGNKCVFMATASITPASISGARSAEQTFTSFSFSPGGTVQVGDFGFVVPPTIGTAVSPAYFRCTTAGTLIVCWVNGTAGALTPDAGVYTFVVFRP